MYLQIFKQGVKRLIGIATLVVCMTTPAAAQTEPEAPYAKTQARAALKEGARLLEKRQFAAALARFQEAYGLFPVPQIHYNFGLAYVGLARNPEAFDSFGTFLREMKDPPSVQLLKATEQVERLKQLVMLVSIACDVQGARVLVDGRLRGLTPLPRPIALEPGAHELLVEHEGSHDPVLRSLFGAGGQNITVSLSLKPKLDSTPRAAAPTAVAPLPANEDLALHASPPPAPEEEHPFYKRAWFWGGLAVATAAVVGSIMIFSSDGDVKNCPAVGVDTCLQLQ